MLIETSSTVAAASIQMPQPARTEDRRGARDGAEIAAHHARTARIERALDALDDLARTRRTYELVEAIERLGAGLGSTITSLDDTLATMAGPHRLAIEAPSAWEPISAPLVPITAFVAGPDVAPAAAPADVAPVHVPSPAPAATAVVVPAAAPAPALPGHERRQAPAGLAAFVIDFPATQG
ncbi:hypothetical protein [Patulibacter sp.]|uniref:hypothetical protein n=1 Tax=Patulibacter sp. TaxID=1912859 RepID=UPI0027208354|nr:hypothetical protein [Patulibacter sp.]MDO9410188.1 hypothetical protein [Patulibacter sp.]